MIKGIKTKWFYLVVLVFTLLNAFFIYKENYWFSVLPLVLILVSFAFLSSDKLLLILVFMVPLSVPISNFFTNLPIDMFLPTEPILVIMMLVFIAKLFYNNKLNKDVVTHPVSIAIYLYLIWIFITSLTSTMPLVSIKFFVSKLWFITVFYFLATQLFQNKQNVKKYVLLYSISLSLVVIYALLRHYHYGIFDQKIAHWSANPFYKDHTSYGAILAMYIPPIVGMAFYKQYTHSQRFFYTILALLLIVALVFSYSRAAWLGLIIGLGVFVLIKLKIRFSVILTTVVVLFTIIFAFGNDIMRKLEANTQDSSTDIVAHIQSISNISSDASNLERLNRWNCAISMFKEKPFVGWGPGTYMFQYAPFQLSYDKTIISTREGNMGNAHSEYLGPLAEQGVLGTLLFVVMIVLTVTTGLRAVKNTQNKELKMLALVVLLGLFTYYFHGLVNNFLDTDKASASFWGFTAILVAIDVYYKKGKNKIEC